jgi:putative NIF3 family GTP cyclohydrolase 1 type 2
MASEDGIYRGFDQEFDWTKYRMPYPKSDDFIDKFGACYDLPETTLRELCIFFKEKLGMQVVQIVGNPDMKVKRVSVLVGGGSLGLGEENMPMRHMEKYNVDVAICGDITEWTLSAYVRDAAQLGMNKGMLVLGHERSEEAGMKHMPEWMKSITGDIEVEFIDAKEPFLYLS